MKKLLLATLASCALVTPALAGPDFIASSTKGSSLSASSGTSEIGPLDDLTFEHNSARLSPESADQLTTVARWLKKHPQQKLVIEGYTDLTGSSAYNEDLATRRASIVRSHLIARGVDPTRLLVIAYGEQGADFKLNPLDRRVILYTSDRPFPELVQKSFAVKRAATAMWQSKDALFTERRGTSQGDSPRTVVSRR